NLNAESQGRLQVVRLYEQTTDAGVRDMLSFLIARDTMHQNQWLAAIDEIERMERSKLVPASFPRNLEFQEVSYDFNNFSAGEESQAGRWANGPALDGTDASFNYVAAPIARGQAPVLNPPPPFVHSTPGMAPELVN